MPRAFEFRLETVLRVREQRQREAQRRLAARQAEMVRLERLDEQLAAQVGAAQSELRAVQAGSGSTRRWWRGCAAGSGTCGGLAPRTGESAQDLPPSSRNFRRK